MPGKSGHIIIKNLVEMGYAGAVYPINPRAKNILGRTAYPSIALCPETPEVAVIAVPRDMVPDSLRQAAEKGTRHAIIASAGFADTGDDVGQSLDNEIRQIARQYTLRYMGPNSIGTINSHNRFITSITHNVPLPVGPVSFFGQTGLFASGVTRQLALTEKFGVAKIACLGNKNDVDEIALLRFMADDEQTGIIGAYVEGTSDGRAFLQAATYAASRKPLIVLKGGQSRAGSQAAAGHTGTLAGDAQVFSGVLRQARAVAANDLEDFFDLLAGFAHGPRPRGRRLGVISITGAGCVLSADAAEKYEMQIAELSDSTVSRIRRVCPAWAPVRNPVDMWSAIEKSGVEAAYREIGLALAQDPQVDALVLIITLFPGTIFDIGPIIAEIKQAAPDKPVVTALIGGGPEENCDWMIAAHRGGAATFANPVQAIRVLAAMAEERPAD